MVAGAVVAWVLLSVDVAEQFNIWNTGGALVLLTVLARTWKRQDDAAAADRTARAEERERFAAIEAKLNEELERIREALSSILWTIDDPLIRARVVAALRPVKESAHGNGDEEASG